MRLNFTNDEVRLLIDVLKGEVGRLHHHRQLDEIPGDWLDRRIDFVDELTERFKAVRK